MNENRKTILPGRVRRALAAAVLLAVLLCALPLPALCASEPDYIVSLRDGDAPFAVVREREMLRLERAGRLRWYEPDGDAVLLGLLSPYYEDAQWNLDMIGADAAFRQDCLGQGVRVGVLDSGVNPHPDLAGRLLPGHNYIPDTPEPDDTSDSYGHGTRIAGLIAAVGELGYIGTAPGAEIVPLKVTDGQSVRISALCDAIYGAIDEYGCQVLNLSMGVYSDYNSLREAVDYAEAKNVVVVAAAGNGGGQSVCYPAAYESVIGVGAVESDGIVYYRSNHNESVFLTAPGVDVRSTAAQGGYSTSSGTSFAVPQVSGAAAVLLGMEPGLTCAEIRALLADTASDSGIEGYDEYYGYGVLNLAGCVAALTERAEKPAERFALLPETGPAAAVRNNGEEDAECVYLLAYYDENGVCLRVTERRVTVPANAAAELEPPGEGYFGQFLCEADTMRPLLPARKGTV